MTCWAIVRSKRGATPDTIMKFVQPEIILPWQPPRGIFWDSSTGFMAASVQVFTGRHSIGWKAIIAYALVDTLRAERMIGTVTREIKILVVQIRCDWAEKLLRVTYGYRRRSNSTVSPPFQLMYEVNSWAPRHVRDEIDPTGFRCSARGASIRALRRVFAITAVKT